MFHHDPSGYLSGYLSGGWWAYEGSTVLTHEIEEDEHRRVLEN